MRVMGPLHHLIRKMAIYSEALMAECKGGERISRDAQEAIAYEMFAVHRLVIERIAPSGDVWPEHEPPDDGVAGG